LSSMISLLSFCNESNSRFPLKPTSAWTVNYEEMETDSYNREGDEKLKFYIENDTVISTKTYFKLYKSGIAYYDTPYQFDHIYVGAIRDENNNIYFIEKEQFQEQTLYDFNISQGDTIRTEIEKGMEVTSIETLADDRLKINIRKTDFIHGKCSNYNNTFLIEGIGSMGGLFYESPCNHVGFREHYLVCYSEEGNLIYENELSTIKCKSSTSINSLIENYLQIKIFPDPVSDRLKIEIKNKPENKLAIEIYNISGIIVFRQLINDSKIEIDLEKFRKGIYFIRISDINSYLTRKLMIE
jgi:hypothetical protein